MSLHVMEFNRPASLTKFKMIAEAMGEKTNGLSLIESSKKAVSAMAEILKDLGVSTMLRDYGISKDDLPELADIAVKSGGRLLASNPRNLSLTDALEIYQQAW